MKMNTKNKNMRKGNNSLFLCFRPVGGLEPESGSGRAGGGDPVLTYIAVRKKEGVVFPKATSPANDNETVSSEGKGLEDFHGKKISGSRRFSNVLKAVLFEVSLARKIKKGKSDKKSKNLLSESARYNYQTSSNNNDFEFDFGQRIISSSVFTSATSSSASIATNSNSQCPSYSSSSVTKTTSFVSSSTGSKKSHENVHKNYSGRGYYSCNCGLFLMLISLLVLVFWGKICAIFCTSTWFFFMPRSIVKSRDQNECPTPTENSSESKRKIVMEGLLARQRGSFRCQ